MQENPCGSCNKCCIGTRIQINQKDIDRWEKEQRYDILLCLERWSGFGVFLIHKKNNEECIFLDNKKGCTIHPTRPKVCRDFPKGKIHVKQFNCSLDPKTKMRTSNKS